MVVQISGGFGNHVFPIITASVGYADNQGRTLFFGIQNLPRSSIVRFSIPLHIAELPVLILSI